MTQVPEGFPMLRPERKPGAARVTKPKSDFDKEFEQVRKHVLLRDSYRCRALVDPICRVEATDVHHVLARARGGDNSMENLLSLCRPCHNWVDRYPAAAEACGLLRRSAS